MIKSPGAVLIDNYTLYDVGVLLTKGLLGVSKVTIFKRHEGHVESQVIKSPAPLPLALANLSNLLEAIILFPRIYTVESFSYTWVDNPNLKELISNNIVSLIRINYDKNQVFQEKAEADSKICREMSEYIQFIDKMIQNKIARLNLPKVYLHKENMARFHQDLKSGYLYNVTGSFYYQQISSAYSLPYVPSSIRVPSCLFNLGFRPLTNFAKQAIDLLQAKRRKALARINEFYMWDIDVPLILALVLKESSYPEDVIPIALQIRDLKECKNFRDWATEVDTQASRGNWKAVVGSLSNLQKVI